MSSKALPEPQEQNIVIAQDVIGEVIREWLKAKTNHSNSRKTNTAYATTLDRFRVYLRGKGYDLTSVDAVVAHAAQQWAMAPWNGQARKSVSASTFNQRLAILSSFYSFARRRYRLVSENPIDLLDRRKVQAYAKARALDEAVVERCLSAIDRSSLEGLRDYALLSVAFTTGRRLSELVGLRWGAVELSGSREQPTITLTFQAKGDKVMRDTLEPEVAESLLRYLQAAYQNALTTLLPSAPLWLSLAPHFYGEQVALERQGIAAIYKRRVGTSKVHTSRHTFAQNMIASGAPVTVLQARLGHSSLATTGTYTQALESAENPYADKLVERFGIKAKKTAEEQPL